MRDIIQIFSGTIITAGGLGLTVNFLNALLLVGIVLIAVGICMLFRVVIAR